MRSLLAKNGIFDEMLPTKVGLELPPILLSIAKR